MVTSISEYMFIQQLEISIEIALTITKTFQLAQMFLPTL